MLKKPELISEIMLNKKGVNMLHAIKDIENFKLKNKNQDLGHIKDFYIDDLSWVTRYIVVDTGSWLTGKKVLISPHSLKKPNFLDNVIYTDLTQEQIKGSPHISEKEPVSRQHEIDLRKYYGWPAYWSMTTSMQGILDDIKKEIEAEESKEKDPHLRSIRELRGYDVQAIDGDVGIVDSFIIDDDKWVIKYIVFDARKWLHWLPGGKYFLFAPEWTKDIKWDNSKIIVNLDRDTIENGPEFTSAKDIDSQFENKLYICYKSFLDKKIVDVK